MHPILDQFQRQHPNLFHASQEWIREGWGTDVEISPLMVAAALEKEAITQDACVAEGTSDPYYPSRLRVIAMRIMANVADELRTRVNEAGRQFKPETPPPKNARNRVPRSAREEKE